MSILKQPNLLLIGRTGNGKSSTGNSILNYKAFHASMNSQPLTEEDIQTATKQVADRQVTVVDGPGIGDASLDHPDDVQKTITFTDKLFTDFPDGFTAVVLVLKYGERFTKQEKDTVTMMKGILGSKILETHGVIVMTRGDNFQNDQEEDGRTFEEWCRQQTGEIAEIFKECSNRFVLFNNRTKESKQLDKQRKELLDMIPCEHAYKKCNYDAAKADRNRLILASELGIMKQNNTKIIDEINDGINKLDISRRPGDAITSLTYLESKLEDHKKKLQKKTNGADVAKNLFVELDLVELTLTSKRKLAESYLQLQEKDTDETRKQTKHVSNKLLSGRELPKPSEHSNKRTAQTGNTETFVKQSIIFPPNSAQPSHRHYTESDYNGVPSRNVGQPQAVRVVLRDILNSFYKYKIYLYTI